MKGPQTMDAPVNPPNIAIIVDEGEITSVVSDQPEKVGTVIIVNRSESTTAESADGMIPITKTDGYIGTYAYVSPVEESSLRDLIHEISESDPRATDED